MAGLAYFVIAFCFSSGMRISYQPQEARIKRGKTSEKGAGSYIGGNCCWESEQRRSENFMMKRAGTHSHWFETARSQVHCAYQSGTSHAKSTNWSLTAHSLDELQRLIADLRPYTWMIWGFHPLYVGMQFLRTGQT
jgi:hypothetical protein